MNAVYKNKQYIKFSAYGFLKNLRLFDAFILLYLLQNQLTYTQIGLLYAIREISTNLFEIPSGLLADTYGRKYALMASFGLYILSFGIFYVGTLFFYFALAFAFYGIADAFRSGTHKGMIMDYLSQQGWQASKIEYYGHTRSWSQRGSAISSVLAGLIVLYTGNYKYIFMASMIPYLLNIVLISSYPNALNLSKLHASKRNFSHSFKSFIKVVRQVNVLTLINNSALHSAYLKAVKDYIQPLLFAISVTIPWWGQRPMAEKSGVLIGILYFIIYMLSASVSKLAGKAAAVNKTKIAFVTLIAGFSLGVITGYMMLQQYKIPALIAFVGIYLIENLRKPILTGLVADHVPASQLVSVLSAQSQLKTILTSVLAISFGLIADHWSIGVAILTVSATLILVLLASNLIKKLEGLNEAL